MEQLPLEVRLADYAVFESFFPGPNAEAVQTLRSVATDGRAEFIWIWGAPGCGKSHLMQAAVVLASFSYHAAMRDEKFPRPKEIDNGRRWHK